jgi:hypothetical protein
MTVSKLHEEKTTLLPMEKLKVAYFHLLRGVPQHVLADMFDVNAGRVAEAIGEIRKAIEK